MNNKIAKWRKWVNLICHDCGSLMLSRDMYNDIRAMVQKNPSMRHADYFNAYIAHTYVAHTAMMLRKHIKTDANSISLALLAADLLKNKDLISWPSCINDFQSLFDTFKANAQKIENFADRVIAHRDRRQPTYIPTYSDIEYAIRSMDALCIQCSIICNGNYSVTCKPTVQCGWLRIFREMGIET